MKSIFFKLALLLTTSCICGICSKDNTQSDDNNDNTINLNQVFDPEKTWVYFNDNPSLVYFYPGNKRPQLEKWEATKITPAFSGIDKNTGNRYLSWFFENTGNTRYLSNDINPGGKEYFSLFIKNIAASPITGSYTLDINYKQGYCWYEVFNSSGKRLDSTRTPAISNSAFNITKMDFVQSITATVDRYLMSGNATFNIMYWPNGTASTTDVHTLQCSFNKVFVDFLK